MSVETSAADLAERRNLNSNERGPEVSIAARRIAMLSSVPRGLAMIVFDAFQKGRWGLPPKFSTAVEKIVENFGSVLNL